MYKKIDISIKKTHRTVTMTTLTDIHREFVETHTAVSIQFRQFIDEQWNLGEFQQYYNEKIEYSSFLLQIAKYLKAGRPTRLLNIDIDLKQNTNDIPELLLDIPIPIKTGDRFKFPLLDAYGDIKGISIRDFVDSLYTSMNNIVGNDVPEQELSTVLHKHYTESQADALLEKYKKKRLRYKQIYPVLTYKGNIQISEDRIWTFSFEI